jgi:hypothetical protein
MSCPRIAPLVVAALVCAGCGEGGDTPADAPLPSVTTPDGPLSGEASESDGSPRPEPDITDPAY